MKKILIFLVGAFLLAGCGARREMTAGADFCTSDVGVKYMEYQGRSAGGGNVDFMNGASNCENKNISFDIIYKKKKLDELDKLNKTERDVMINLDVTRIRNNMCFGFANINSPQRIRIKYYMLNGNLDNVHVSLKQLDGKIIAAFDVNANVCKYR